MRSTAPGTVAFAGREGAFGKVVRIEHDFGISTLYAHLSRITVSVGDYVAENTVIGKMGNTGRSAGSHLHYEIQVDGQYAKYKGWPIIATNAKENSTGKSR